MIAFEHHLKKDLHMPVILCDYCKKRIMKSGNVLWIQQRFDESSPAVVVSTPQFFHTHKRCNRDFEAHYRLRHGPVRFYYNEISSYLAQLVNNVVFDSDLEANRLYDLVEKRIAEPA